MGILIAAGLGLLIYAVIGGLPTTQTEGFGDTTVVLPPGCVIAEAVVAEGTLVLRADGPMERGCQLVILLDPETGRERGRVKTQEGP
jgi:hypothetical protein